LKTQFGSNKLNIANHSKIEHPTPKIESKVIQEQKFAGKKERKK
jgi:hypothetical protein